MSGYQGWGHRMPDYQLMPPFPYFGGKRNAAPAVWEALGDVGGYIEPFAGSAAVLLGRPPFEGPRVETINDADGQLVNAWRAIKHDPEGVVREGFGPMSEIDYHARAAWLAEWRTTDPVSWLEGDPEVYDLKAGAWWLYTAACSFGKGMRVGGPWHVVDGRLERTERSEAGITRQIPCIGSTGRGLLRTQPRSFGDTDAERATTYVRQLQERLMRVRITAGDWTRPLAPSVLNLTIGPGEVGVFLDPPYESTTEDIYAVALNPQIAIDVREWCLAADPGLRIVLAGYDDDNDELLAHGWRKQDSIGGQGKGFSSNPENGRRERLWISPACHTSNGMLPLWESGGAA